MLLVIIISKQESVFKTLFHLPSVPADAQQNLILVYFDSVSLFSFNEFIFITNLFNSFIWLLFLHSSIFILYPIAGCLCNNDVFLQLQLIHSIVQIFVQICFVLSISIITFKNTFSFKNFSFISKISYSFKNLCSLKNFSSITFQFVYAGMTGQSRKHDCYQQKQNSVLQNQRKKKQQHLKSNRKFLLDQKHVIIGCSSRNNCLGQ